ncbi:MAG: hypothetical protein ACRC8C_00940 [Mycoplasmoidaceae bacterium]
MTNNNLDDLLKINSENESLIFIKERFEGNNYRGIHLFQHNRCGSNKFYSMLEVIKDYSKNSEDYWVEIPIGDENNGKNNGYSLGNYPSFQNIVNSIKNKTGSGTAQTLQKNYFPDWEKMELIERRKDKYSNKKYFKLSYKIISTNIDYWIENDFYKMSIYKVFENYIYDLFCILDNIDEIKELEFLLFFTYIDNLSERWEDVLGLINSWRNLSYSSRENAISILKEYMNPKNYKGLPKNKKKDYGNFKNETQQIISNLDASGLFIVENSNIVLKKSNKNKFIRNKKPKDEYFAKHKVSKKLGYEMDHIVKFSFATSIEDVIYLDNYKNLIYISGTEHNIKTQLGSNHMILSENKNGFSLADVRSRSENIDLVFNSNLEFNKDLTNEYLSYNIKLLEKYCK